MATAPRDELDILLRDVKDRPDDDTARLILADWLQDAGDPRGEFIHLQVRRHRLAEDDPARQRLQRRERQLLCRHSLSWVGPFLDHVSIWFFLRGLIVFEARADRLLGDALPCLAESDTCRWVEELKLSDARARHIRTLADSPLLGHLVALDLTDNRLTDEGLLALLSSRQLGQLRSLRLANNRLGPPAITALAGCAQLSGLHRLDLSRNRVGDAGAAALVASPHLAQLDRLTLSGAGLTVESILCLQQRFGARLRLRGRQGET